VKDQWGLHRIGFTPLNDPDSAWNIYDGANKNVLVAVIDSGIDMSHPDKPKYIWKNTKEIPNNGIDDDHNGYVDDIHGWNFLNENNDLTDLRGHGTFVSGIIAAKRDNQIGIAGINPGAEIMMLKVTDKDGNTNSFNVFRAIHYAVKMGARVINISLGGHGVSQLEQLAINYAHARGIFVAVASGNTGEYTGDVGPAASRNVVTVGSLNWDGTKSTISSKGPNNGLLAPGEEIYSLHSKEAGWQGPAGDKERRYYKASGTSFSTPMVAATASLILAKNPQLTNREVEDIILSTATDLEIEGWDWKTGAGLLNAKEALKANPKNVMVTKVTGITYNKVRKGRGKERFDSADVFATVRGAMVKDFVVEVGKGKRAKKFKKVAGPFKSQADHSWVARIGKDDLKGSDEWIVQISAIGKNGQKKIARALLEIEK